MLPILDGLAPILNEYVRTLVLGSFPSPASLMTQHYYGHQQNQFWRIMGAVLGESLIDMDYGSKQRCLLLHRVGVWDVFRCCRREGALDSAIQAAKINDFCRLETLAPELRRVCFNGKVAGKSERWFVERGYETHILPSTSPAYTLSIERKIQAWKTVWDCPA